MTDEFIIDLIDVVDSRITGFALIFLLLVLDLQDGVVAFLARLADEEQGGRHGTVCGLTAAMASLFLRRIAE